MIHRMKKFSFTKEIRRSTESLRGFQSLRIIKRKHSFHRCYRSDEKIYSKFHRNLFQRLSLNADITHRLIRKDSLTRVKSHIRFLVGCGCLIPFTTGVIKLWKIREMSFIVLLMCYVHMCYAGCHTLMVDRLLLLFHSPSWYVWIPETELCTAPSC